MLTLEQQEFVNRRPDANIKIIQFDPTSDEKFEEIKREIQSILGNVEVLHRGSSGLGIAGQAEIDVYIPTFAEEIPRLTMQMKEVFGEPKSIRVDERTKFIKFIDKTMIEIILVNKLCKSWIEGELFFDYLEKNKDFKNKYEELKAVGQDLSIKEYYRRKFEFMNEIVNKVKLSN